MIDDQPVPPDFLGSGSLESAVRRLGVNLVGASIGSYQITSLLGVGGMGEVYRARDTKLQRDVAIKVLPAAFVADGERRARFEREAQVLARLNHPHIGAIYGLEETDGVRCLVLELIEGDTLADRITEGRGLPVKEALSFARQIAEALEVAHQKGIIHRDLKPSNIAITRDGTVKVLDFGLAKVTQVSDIAMEMSGTKEGAILGTAAYMSPEQARGQSADARTDVWAFGCVLYEMLTGRMAFQRTTTSDPIAAILEHEPDWSALPHDLSPTLQVYLRRCLQKNPRDRVHDVADVRLALEGAFEVPIDARASRTGRERLAWSLAALAIVVAVAVRSLCCVCDASTLSGGCGGALLGGATAWRQPPDRRFVRRIPGRPDDRVPGECAGGVGHIFTRRLHETDAHPVAGTDNAGQPFWSPDSRSLGFSKRGRYCTELISTVAHRVDCAKCLPAHPRSVRHLEQERRDRLRVGQYWLMACSRHRRCADAADIARCGEQRGVACVAIVSADGLPCALPRPRVAAAQGSHLGRLN